MWKGMEDSKVKEEEIPQIGNVGLTVADSESESGQFDSEDHLRSRIVHVIHHIPREHPIRRGESGGGRR